MTSSIFELLLFSLPSFFYIRALQRRGKTSTEARAAVGWRMARMPMYGLAVLVSAALLPITYVALQAISGGALDTSSRLHVTYGNATTLGGYVSVALLAVAEEILFRGLLGGILVRRCGFAVGNALQALIFLVPHLLLLLVSAALWPLLPVQLASGWLLGWLRHKSCSIGPCSLAHIIANVLAPLLLAA